MTLTFKTRGGYCSFVVKSCREAAALFNPNEINVIEYRDTDIVAWRILAKDWPIMETN